MREVSFSWSILGKALEVASGLVGLIGIIYGSYVLLVEQAKVPLCSLELLEQQNSALMAQQPKITVEVMGAVNQPGVWQFDREERVGKAIEQADGLSEQANGRFVAKTLNMAAVLSDGEKIYVPFIDEDFGIDSSIEEKTTQISINTASLEKLQGLNGIGESRATTIIENRPYGKINELVDKKVLSSGMFEDLKDLLSL
jgi:competence protein ComEA